MKKINLKQILTICLLICFSTSGFAVSAKVLKQGQRFAKVSDAGKLLERLNFESTPLPLNYFQKIRIELNKAAQAEAVAAKNNGVMVNSLLRLTPDTLGFFVATGAVNFMTMWNASSGNPLLFQQQVIGLKDPIANLSFYSFIAANGFYSNWQTSKLTKMSPQAREMAMRKISYAGMAAGSLASSVTADIGASITACSKTLLTNTTAENKAVDDSACETALKVWSVRNLTQKYLPQIVSLMVVQAATEFTHKGVAWSAQKFLGVLKSIGVKTGLKISAIDVVLYATPGKFGIQLFKIAGQVTQFALFVSVDHLLNDTLTRGLNNILKPALFKTFDMYTLNSLFAVGTKYQWDIDKISTLTPMVFPENRSNVKSNEAYLNFNDFSKKFPAEIANFTERMQEWRDHLNSNAEQDLSEWMNLTTRMYNQVQISEKFYDSFLSELFTFSNISYRTQLPASDSQSLPMKSVINTTGFPYRTLPLYGVKFIPWINNDGKTTNVAEDQAYILFPKETEKAQSDYLREFATTMLKSNDYQNLKFTPIHKEFMNSMLQKLMSTIPTEQGAALKNLVEYPILQNQIGLQAVSNQSFIKLRAAMLNKIGIPQAKLNRGEGFSEAFILANKAQIEAADFDGASLITSNTSMFNAGSILMQQMICGGSIGKIQNYEIGKTDITVWQPDFISPTIVTSQAKEFCSTKNRINDEDFYTTVSTNSNGQTFKNPVDFIVQNMDMTVLGNYKDKTKKTDFSAWWANNVLYPILPNLEHWEKNYSNLVTKLDENLFSHQKITITSLVDDLTLNNWGSHNILPSKISDSFKFETEFYLRTMNLVVSKKANTNSSQLILTSLDQMLSELKKTVTQLDIKYQTLTDDQLQAVLSDENKNVEYEKQLNYKRYLSFKENFEQGISKFEASVGLKKEEPLAIDNDKSVFQDIKVANSNFEQTVVSTAVQGLHSIEASISRYVRMKLLIRYGLKFSTEDNKKSQDEAVRQACTRGALGCK